MQCRCSRARAAQRHPICDRLHCRHGKSGLDRTAHAAQGRARVRVLRLERRRRGRHDERAVPAPAARGDAVLRARPRRVLRLPGSPAASSRSARTTRGACRGPRTPSPTRSLPSGNDIAVMIGIEPQNRWKHYSRSVVEVARESGAELVVTLGGFLADTPHTRPVPVTGSADGELADQLGLAPSALRGPDRHRRRHPRRLQGGRHPVGEPVGGGPALHLAVAEPEGGARAALAPRAPARHALRHDEALAGGRVVRARGLARGLGRREDQPLRARAREPRRRARRGRRRRGVARRCSRAATTSRPRSSATSPSARSPRRADEESLDVSRTSRAAARTPPRARARSRCRATSARPAPRRSRTPARGAGSA